jgi:hypothetical protein
MKDNGGPAFPLGYQKLRADEPGMSLRDYFAGQALNILDRESYGVSCAMVLAMDAYKIADAMLAERQK